MHCIDLIYGDEKNFAMMSEAAKAKGEMYAAFMRYDADMHSIEIRPLGVGPDSGK